MLPSGAVASNYTYADYVSKGGKLSKRDYRKAIKLYSQKVLDLVIREQAILNLGSNLGKLSLSRIRRTFNSKNKRSINWPESLKQRQAIIDRGDKPYSKDCLDGKKWFVYFNNDYFIRFIWNNKNSKLKNRHVYNLVICDGLKKALRKYLKEDKLNEFKIPLQKAKK